ncbi:MAG TPA: DNA-binding protein WhiA [Candidatus Limnocylindria bacterium]
MLVASELKGELARIHPARTCCRRAELAGLLYAGRTAAGVSTLDHATARVAVQLASSLGIPVEPGRMAPATRRHLEVALDPGLAAGWSWADALACDRRAFLRGVLLSGSVSLTGSGPHIEFVMADPSRAVELRRRLGEMGVATGTLERRGRHVVYLKGREQLGALLRLTGANRALLDFEAEGVARDVRNRVNRLLNAEGANLGRTVRAADRQQRAIDRLESRGELAGLPQALRETATQRRRQPDADLDTLASALGVSRSAVNHRLRRLVALAEEHDDKEAT